MQRAQEKTGENETSDPISRPGTGRDAKPDPVHNNSLGIGVAGHGGFRFRVSGPGSRISPFPRIRLEVSHDHAIRGAIETNNLLKDQC